MPYRKQLEELVTGILRQKELSFRDAGRLTGLHPTTVMDLSNGEARRRSTLIKFAKGMQIPLKTILTAAGYGEGEPVTRADLAREIHAMSQKLEKLASLVLEAE